MSHVIVGINLIGHRDFKLHHNQRDLITVVPITLSEALLGFDKVLLTHLDGRKIKVSNPAGNVIDPSSKKYIRGEGMPIAYDSSRKGDLIILFDVQFPRRLVLSSSNQDQLTSILNQQQDISTVPFERVSQGGNDSYRPTTASSSSSSSDAGGATIVHERALVDDTASDHIHVSSLFMQMVHCIVSCRHSFFSHFPIPAFVATAIPSPFSTRMKCLVRNSRSRSNIMNRDWALIYSLIWLACTVLMANLTMKTMMKMMTRNSLSNGIADHNHRQQHPSTLLYISQLLYTCYLNPHHHPTFAWTRIKKVIVAHRLSFLLSWQGGVATTKRIKQRLHDGNLCNKARNLFGRYDCVWWVAQYTPHTLWALFYIKAYKGRVRFSSLSFFFLFSFSFTAPCLKASTFKDTRNHHTSTLNIPPTALTTLPHTLAPRLLLPPAATA